MWFTNIHTIIGTVNIKIIWANNIPNFESSILSSILSTFCEYFHFAGAFLIKFLSYSETVVNNILSIYKIKTVPKLFITTSESFSVYETIIMKHENIIILIL